MKSKVKKLLVIAPLAILGMLIFVAVGGALVMLLWNWLLPPLFGLRELTFQQAVGILALSRILFGGLGLHGGGGSRSRARRRIKDRLEHLTPEERERLRWRMSERFGFGPPADEGGGQ